MPYRDTVSATAASREPADPGDCLPAGGTWWYRYQPTEDGLVIASTLSTSVAAMTLGAFEGDTPEAMESVDCDTGALSTRPPLGVRAGSTYWFQLTIPAGVGDVVFSLNALGAPRALSEPVGPVMRPEADEAGASPFRPYYPTTSPRIETLDVDDTGSTAVVMTRIAWDPHDDDDMPDIYAVDLATGATTLVSVNTEGRSGNGPSGAPSISGDGRFVLFSSHATDLVDDRSRGGADTNDALDHFIRDLHAGTTERVSLDQHGQQSSVGINYATLRDGVLQYYGGSVSGDGRFVTFGSDLPLHADDPDRGVETHPTSSTTEPAAFINGDIYLVDRGADLQGHQVELLGRDANGDMPDAWFDAWEPRMSGDGSTLVFHSDAPLVPEDRDDDQQDLYALDRVTGALRLVSQTSHDEDHRVAYDTAISHDGRWVAFTSFQPDLVEGDTNDAMDVFRADLHADPDTEGAIVRVSVTSDGQQATATEDPRGGHLRPISVSISDDGRFVTWAGPWPLAEGDQPRPQAANSSSSNPTWEYDAYVRDVVTGTTTLVSTTADGRAAQHGTNHVAVSGDGGTLLMSSLAHLGPCAVRAHPPGGRLTARRVTFASSVCPSTARSAIEESVVTQPREIAPRRARSSGERPTPADAAET